MDNIQAKAILEKEKLWESNERIKTAFDIAIKALETVDKITPCYLGSPCEYQTEDVNHNHGWIPCNERMPNKEEYLKDDGRFIVTDGNRVYQSIYDIYINQCFKTLQLNCLVDLGYQSNFEVDKRVIAWRSLPSPYEITI